MGSLYNPPAWKPQCRVMTVPSLRSSGTLQEIPELSMSVRPGLYNVHANFWFPTGYAGVGIHAGPDVQDAVVNNDESRLCWQFSGYGGDPVAHEASTYQQRFMVVDTTVIGQLTGYVRVDAGGVVTFRWAQGVEDTSKEMEISAGSMWVWQRVAR